MKGLIRWTWMLAACLQAACGSHGAYVWYSELPKSEGAPISAGARIAVSVDEHPELSGEFEVGAAGAYNQPLAGAILVGGKSASEAAALISRELSRFVQAPRVEVTLSAHGTVSVPVLGEVRSPGAYPVRQGASVLTALASAGGLSDFADEDYIFVLRSSPTPLRIRFRYADLVTPAAQGTRFALQDGDAILVE
jgi:polysaccharide biosynthesis/export protein